MSGPSYIIQVKKTPTLPPKNNFFFVFFFPGICLLDKTLIQNLVALHIPFLLHFSSCRFEKRKLLFCFISPNVFNNVFFPIFTDPTHQRLCHDSALMYRAQFSTHETHVKYCPHSKRTFFVIVLIDRYKGYADFSARNPYAFDREFIACLNFSCRKFPLSQKNAVLSHFFKEPINIE